MPETLIAIVALIGADEGSEDVAIGAIVGAPFLLATLAMGLVGLFAYIYRRAPQQGVELDAHGPTLERDLLFFLAFFARRRGARLGRRRRRCGSPVGVVFLCAYLVYIRLHAARRRRGPGRGDARPAALRPPRGAPRTTRRWRSASLQLLVGLGAMVGGAHLFVEELLEIADSLGVDALVLALILAPLATELPEKVNSFFWVREGKDALALGNISGAMVFQSTIPVGIGLIFTDWALSGNADPLDRPRPRRRPARLREPAPRPPLQTPAVIGWFALYASSSRRSFQRLSATWRHGSPVDSPSLPAVRAGESHRGPAQLEVPPEPSSTSASCFFG